MIQTVEAVVDKHGSVRLLQPIEVSGTHRALVTILDEEPAPAAIETAVLSEHALSEDWNRSEEEDAWSHLQPDR